MDNFQLTEQEIRIRELHAEIVRRAAAVEREKAAEAAKRERPKRPRTAKLTPTEQKRYAELIALTGALTLDMRWPQLARSLLPAEWKDIDATPVPDKTRITLRVDADVAKFYRKLGPGYQRVMNDVLRSFMLAKLVEIIGLGEQPLEFAVAQTEEQLERFQREAELVRELEELRKKRVGIGSNLQTGG
ncbi:MAG: BrnA antitoxin family protein [Pseudomonadota bacterium]